MRKTGYGNPPKHSQFKKGQSGNRNGRPSGSKNFDTIIMEAARDQGTATIGGKPRKISKIHATAIQLATKAAGGDPASIARFLDWVDKIERREGAAEPPAFPFSDADLKVLRAIDERMKLCLPPEAAE